MPTITCIFTVEQWPAAIPVLGDNDMAVRRFAAYADRRNFRSPRFLGSGKDGVVHEVESNDFPGFVAVKSFYRAGTYERERDVYVRLREEQVMQVRGFHVPQLIAMDDDFLTIEITVVAPPYILDFADARLDEGPEYSDEVWVEWNRKLDEDFGVQADVVRRLLAVLESHGVILLDVHPGNFRFA